MRYFRDNSETIKKNRKEIRKLMKEFPLPINYFPKRECNM